MVRIKIWYKDQTDSCLVVHPLLIAHLLIVLTRLDGSSE